jgi:hypothetical protein
VYLDGKRLDLVNSGCCKVSRITTAPGTEGVAIARPLL